jgi:hypothetical protein
MSSIRNDRRPSFRGRPGGCANPQRAPQVARRSGPEDDPVCHWIVIRHKLANETTRLDAQGIRPNQIAVRMNAGPPVLELGNDHVGFLSHPPGQLGLGQAAFVPQLAQPATRLVAKCLRSWVGSAPGRNMGVHCRLSRLVRTLSTSSPGPADKAWTRTNRKRSSRPALASIACRTPDTRRKTGTHRRASSPSFDARRMDR